MVCNAVGMSTSEKLPFESITWMLEQDIVKMLVFISHLSSIIFMDNMYTQDGLLLLLSVWLRSTLGYFPSDAAKGEQG